MNYINVYNNLIKLTTNKLLYKNLVKQDSFNAIFDPKLPTHKIDIFLEPKPLRLLIFKFDSKRSNASTVKSFPLYVKSFENFNYYTILLARKFSN